MSRPTFNRFLKQLTQKGDGPKVEAEDTPASTTETPAVATPEVKKEEVAKEASTNESFQPSLDGVEFEVAGKKEPTVGKKVAPVLMEEPSAPKAVTPIQEARPAAVKTAAPKNPENIQSKVQEDKSNVTITPNVGNKGLNKIILSKQQFEDINSTLEKLQEKTKCSAAILSDISGLIVAHKGSMNSDSFSTLSALAAANYAATSEMASLIGETEGFNMHYHEGPEYNLYVTAAQKQFIFVVVFSKDTTFGMVRVLSTKVVKELINVLSRQDQLVEDGAEDPVKDSLNDNEFHDELTSRLDSVLFGSD